jgi:RNA polymerase sigma factor (sigma-70 family)
MIFRFEVTNMDYTLATNDQLKAIASHDKYCPSSLLRGLAVEMISRHLFDNLIMFAGRQAYRSLNYVLKKLNIKHSELIHIGHIEILHVVDKFKPGMRTFTSYIVMCLIAKFKKMDRDAHTEKRMANIGTKNVDALEEKMQEKIFQSPVNVEKYVIDKITIEECWPVLREVEKKAIVMDLQGYSQYEIALALGFKKTYGITLLKRAYEKLRKALVA